LKKNFFLTGRPGIGKTTVLLTIVEGLRKEGLKVGGMISREIREKGSRVGFKVIDLEDGKEGWLAHVRQPFGPKVGKYRVCMKDLESIGVNAILKAVRDAEIVVIDEVGPMELFSQAFRKALVDSLNSKKTILGTIHYRVKTPIITEIKERKDIAIIEVTHKNRVELPEKITHEILKIYGKQLFGKAY